MKTIEAAYIMPVVFIITAISILLSLRLHDWVVSYSVSYGMLIDQAASLENKDYKPAAGYTKKEISDIINNFCLVSEKPSLSVCLSGASLYIQDNHNPNSTTAFFSGFERCDTIRKESTFIINLLRETIK